MQTKRGQLVITYESSHLKQSERPGSLSNNTFYDFLYPSNYNLFLVHDILNLVYVRDQVNLIPEFV